MKKAVFLVMMLISVSAFAQKEWDDFNIFRDKANSMAGKDSQFFKDQLSRQFDLGTGDLEKLFPRFNSSWGDLLIALEMRRITNRPISTIADAFEQKKGWGSVAKELGIKPGSDEFKRMKDFMNGYENNWKVDWDKKNKGDGNSKSNSGHGNKGNGSSKNKGQGKR